MENYEKELLADFASDSDEEIVLDEQVEEPTSVEISTKTLDEKLEFTINNYTAYNQFHLIQAGSQFTSKEDLTKYSLILPLIPELINKIASYDNQEETDFEELLASVNHDQSPEYKFILSINELSTIINQEIESFHAVLKMQYKVVFPELETIIRNPVDYAKIIFTIKQDLQNIRNHESELKKIVTNEKVLIIIMAAIQQQSKQFVLNDDDVNRVLDCCDIIFTLDDILYKLSQFVSSKISMFAPNVCALIGSMTTAQLLISTGSLRQLALTPSCNLASLGVKDLSSSSKNTVRQGGYLYYSEFIKSLPQDIKKQVIRILSGKIILAARIDLSKSNLSGDIGRDYLSQVHTKIEKLITPPEQQPDKALPIPIDQKSKKRGGKRFRKMKERFQMSELRKAQNRMEFGKQEETILDSYGDEVGLGMSHNNQSRIGKININKNTGAKMTKAMSQRLQQTQNNGNLIETDSISLPTIDTKPNLTSLAKSKDSPMNKWLNGMSR